MFSKVIKFSISSPWKICCWSRTFVWCGYDQGPSTLSGDARILILNLFSDWIRCRPPRRGNASPSVPNTKQWTFSSMNCTSHHCTEILSSDCREILHWHWPVVLSKWVEVIVWRGERRSGARYGVSRTIIVIIIVIIIVVIRIRCLSWNEPGHHRPITIIIQNRDSRFLGHSELRQTWAQSWKVPPFLKRARRHTWHTDYEY